MDKHNSTQIWSLQHPAEKGQKSTAQTADYPEIKRQPQRNHIFPVEFTLFIGKII